MTETKNKPRENIEVYTRRDWNAEPPISPSKMETPVKHVYYTETDTKECKTKAQCLEIVKGIQHYHMNFKGFSDIQYHFLIGGDGNIYEGRGWFTTGIDYPKANFRIPPEMTGKCIEIAFIGCYKESEPTEDMKVAANSLIYYGLQNNMLVEIPAPTALENFNSNENSTTNDNTSEDG